MRDRAGIVEPAARVLPYPLVTAMLQASSFHETRHRAREFKFLVEPDTADRIETWARARLAPDPYGSGKSGDAYRTTSLYFDTPDFDVLHRRGSFGRSKYRIRRYETAAGTLFLERKLRTTAVLIKRRTADGLDALARLSTGGPQPGWAGEWFRRRLNVRSLRPACQVTYDRTARVGESPSGEFRLTLDRQILARSTEDFGFETGDETPVLDGSAIVEMKFRHGLPIVLKQLVEEFALTPLPVSKYRLSLTALQQIGETRDSVSTSACRVEGFGS